MALEATDCNDKDCVVALVNDKSFDGVPLTEKDETGFLTAFNVFTEMPERDRDCEIFLA